jgi:bacterioferritin
MAKCLDIKVGSSVPEQHKHDLALEHEAVARLNRGVELCRAADDNGSRALLEKILRDEEEHVD